MVPKPHLAPIVAHDEAVAASRAAGEAELASAKTVASGKPATNSTATAPRPSVCASLSTSSPAQSTPTAAPTPTPTSSPPTTSPSKPPSKASAAPRARNEDRGRE